MLVAEGKEASYSGVFGKFEVFRGHFSEGSQCAPAKTLSCIYTIFFG
jgi:hypothetical protein